MDIRAYPKLALIFTEYTIYGARFLYWLETGIDMSYSPNVDYGCGEQVYLKIADAIIEHNRTIENKERQEEEAQKINEIGNQNKENHQTETPRAPLRATDEGNAVDNAAITRINNDWGTQ